MDRSGYARGTLAPRAGCEADVPALDPRPLLTMADMMGDMGMPGMDHGSMPMKGGEGSCGADMPGMKAGENGAAGRSGLDMTVATPRTNLDDPGVGLRDNGRRVLTYADLRTQGAPISRETQRDIVLHLTGHMGRYIWSFDGQKFSDAAPLRLNYGEQVRITLINDTMMTHPIHLHGMWSELETPRANSSCASTPSSCSRRRNSAIASAPMRSAAGPTTAICFTTWKRACFAKSWSRERAAMRRRLPPSLSRAGCIDAPRGCAAGRCGSTMSRPPPPAQPMPPMSERGDGSRHGHA